MTLYKEIEEIIENKREDYFQENNTVDAKKRNSLFKKKLCESGSMIDISFIYLLITGFILKLNVNAFITPNDGSEWYGIFLALSFVEAILPSLLIGFIFCYMIEILYEKTGILFSSGYMFFKLSNKKYKKSAFEKIMHESLSNENIDADFMHKVSPYIKKEDMQTFLVEYKKNPTYANFIIFAKDKEYLEEKRQKQRDEESVKALIGSIYNKE